jgi:hypothetical protein
MIKKSVFEDELIHGMQRELHDHDKKQGMNNLVKAAEYLHSAVQIFEEAGMTAKADQVLRILGRIALAQDTLDARHDSNVKEMPSMKALMDNGVEMEDLRGIGKGDAFSRARVNTAFRQLGYTDKEIAGFIGHTNLMSEDEAATLLDPSRSFGKIKDWIEAPKSPIDPANVQPGEELTGQSLLRPGYDDKLPVGPDELVFKSIAHELGLDDEEEGGIPSWHYDADPESDPEYVARMKQYRARPPTHTKDETVELSKNMGDLSSDLLARFRQMAEESNDVNDAKGKPRKPKNPTTVSDKHTHGLTSEKMLENLKNHGIVFNMADAGAADDLLDADIEDKSLEVFEHGADEKTFEDSD